MEGFIHIRTMGASLGEVMPQVKLLWILTIVYGGLACIGIHAVTTGDLNERIRARVKSRMASLKVRIEGR